MTLSLFELLVVGAIGLAAGVLGGMLGIGGSVVMIPALVFLFHDADPVNLHLYQAAALAVAVAIAAPAAWRHHRRGAIRRDVLLWLAPAAAVGAVAGALLANSIPALALKRIFAVFLLYVACIELWRVIGSAADNPAEGAVVTPARAGGVGGAMGVVSGLLGVGGGVVAVPLAQAVCRLPLRHAIAASSAAMVSTALVAAAVKFVTLDDHGLQWERAAVLALALAPTAMLGAPLGVALAHRLPLNAVRLALVALLALAAWRMSGL